MSSLFYAMDILSLSMYSKLLRMKSTRAASDTVCALFAQGIRATDKDANSRLGIFCREVSKDPVLLYTTEMVRRLGFQTREDVMSSQMMHKRLDNLKCHNF